MTAPSMLAIEAIRDPLLKVLQTGPRVVLTAPPGAGKSTRLPRYLLDLPDLAGSIVVLQPRRLAARLLAGRVAEEMGVALGDVVGFQTRHERAVSATTRIRFVTDGLFLRQLQTSPRLPGVGAVILDEFHERSLESDLALGLVTQLQEGERPDLKLVVMSATLDGQRIADWLRCPWLNVEGRAHPVQVSYLAPAARQPIWDTAADALQRMVTQEPAGDVLVFMPGAREIRRTIAAGQKALGGVTDITWHALHGSAAREEQDRAVRPDPARRKIIISTNIAETSLTIDGVRHVIDSGLANQPRHDARRGLNILEVLPISKASAAQRAGRAGRQAPGTCIRLWRQTEDAHRPAQSPPQCLQLDLTPALLQLLTLGVENPASLPWLDPPPAEAWLRARDVLQLLGAMKGDSVATALGRELADWPVHPRLGRMLAEARRRGCLARACLWAALISERPILAGAPASAWLAGDENEPASDLALLERAIKDAEAAHFAAPWCRGRQLHAGACREVHQAASQLRRLTRCRDEDGGSTAALVQCLLTGFPDHVARKRSDRRDDCALPGHRDVGLDPLSIVRRPGLLLAVDVRQTRRQGVVRTLLGLCSEVEPAWLAELFPEQMRTKVIPRWNEQRQAAESVEQRLYGELVMDETVRPGADPDAAAQMMVPLIRAGQLRLEQWDEAVEQWIARVRCVGQWYPQRPLISYDDADMELILHEVAAGATRFSQVRDRPCLPVVMNALSWDDQQWVQRMAPSQVMLPNGRRLKLTYQVGAAPRGRARIQELFGLRQTPTVAGGRQKVVLEILAPSHRPVQITDDLASFWQVEYPRLRPQLARRYPRHDWRPDPLQTG